MLLDSVSLPGPRAGKVYPLKTGRLGIEKRFRVRLIGPNGIGKTTLLEKIVSGESPGVKIRPGVTVGYYRQDFHNLDHESTVLQVGEYLQYVPTAP